MKKIFLLLILICLIFTGCNKYDYSDWKLVKIPGCGTIMVPNTWNLDVKEDYYYILNENSDAVMVQTYSYASFESSKYYEKGIMESNPIKGQIQSVKYLSSQVLDNSASFGKILINEGNVEKERYYLSLSATNVCVEFLFFDENLDDDFIEKIACSYEGSVYEEHEELKISGTEAKTIAEKYLFETYQKDYSEFQVDIYLKNDIWMITYIYDGFTVGVKTPEIQIDSETGEVLSCEFVD